MNDENINTDEMFSGDEDNTTMAEMVEAIVIAEATAEASKKKANRLKESLINFCTEQGQPKAYGVVNGVEVVMKIVPKLRFSRKATAEMSEVVQWLRDNNLGDLVKTEPYAETTSIKSAVAFAMDTGTMKIEDVPQRLFSVFEQIELNYSTGKTRAFATITNNQ